MHYTKEIRGFIVDVVGGRIFPGVIYIRDGKIVGIEEDLSIKIGPFLMPGLVDAHVHIESSCVDPVEFARQAAVYGTLATVSDPHEIANVLGLEGVRFMIDRGLGRLFDFCWGAPSCVPASSFGTSGAILGPNDIEEMFSWSDVLGRRHVRYLAEVMNFPGVCFGDQNLHAMIATAHRLGLPIDGHAPKVRGEMAQTYFSFGISTDHECTTADEAREKLLLGMQYLIIREGSAAKNFNALIGLIDEFPGRVMFCSDDKHPNDLMRGHINQLVQRAIALGVAPLRAIQAATLTPVKHYGLRSGLMQIGEAANFIEVADLNSMQVLRTWVNGEVIAEDGQSFILPRPIEPINRFEAEPITTDMLEFPVDMSSGINPRIHVIRAHDGELITTEEVHEAHVVNGHIAGCPERDLALIAVINRYDRHARPSIGVITGFGLKRGAIASTVAHDCHNLVVVGTNIYDMVKAVNALIAQGGGLSLACGTRIEVLPFPIAGLMATGDARMVGNRYEELDSLAKSLLGSILTAPYMTLSFMPLEVIQLLKLSDQGLCRLTPTGIERVHLIAG